MTITEKSKSNLQATLKFGIYDIEIDIWESISPRRIHTIQSSLRAPFSPAQEVILH